MDLFSPSEEMPVRLEFWGDEIDSMGFFDVSTQRREENIRRCTVLPAAEALPSLSPYGIEAISRKLEDLAERTVRRRAGIGTEGSASGRASGMAAEMRATAESIRSGLQMPDLDRWLPLLYPPATAFAYIPEDAFVFADQPTRCGEMAKEYRKQLADDLQNMQREGR